ncbi:solute carrier family 15 member 2-like isoform X1 [Amphibalanus amphitrite]|uniref:solute carrier family 15 member 2-like isoform X1 n=2 Tax=Amphibalanus amphitrite TaxID=1232801 RepID=UPI001C916BAA|nr:solute carrier family 15 member 2-like isoform X1 [Amphibalanus amphitrite]
MAENVPLLVGERDRADVYIRKGSRLLRRSDSSDDDLDKTKHKYPKPVFFIIGNEFCERFSFYGMKAILTIYLRNELGYSDDAATVVYHTFNMFCYFTPILGAILADTLLGKFKTIFYISIVYCIGNILLSLAATPPLYFPQTEISILGLALIALGTGGIKPCVSAFGGDQFVLPQQELQLQQFFSIFYFAINAGSLISTVLTPILRNDVHCFGSDSCYPLAFGVPAVLMIVALILFLIGKPWYKCTPPQGNVILEVGGVITHAVSKKVTSSDKRDHWLDHADDKYSQKLIADVKAVLSVLFLYIPIPIFWALFDQQGSRWTLQATQMNGEVGSWLVLPDQIQVVNPLLILALIPCFQTFIYPAFSKCNLLKKPLQRMGVGGMLAVLSFILAGLVELKLESQQPVLPDPGMAHLRIVNSLPCSATVTPSWQSEPLVLPSMEIHRFIVSSETEKLRVDFSVGDCAGTTLNVKQGSQELVVRNMKSSTSMLLNSFGTLQLLQTEHLDDLHKDLEKGYPKLKVLYSMPGVSNGSTIRMTGNPENTVTFKTGASNFGDTEYQIVYPEEYKVFLPRASGEISDDPVTSDLYPRLGGSYSLLVVRDEQGHEFQKMFTLTEPNSVHMFWLIPQYFVITVGEVMFSITGLEFSFTQAPVQMKSVLQAAWLLTVSFGNLLDVVIVEMEVSDKQSHEFFFFAALMFLDMLLFCFLAYRYKYVEDKVEDELRPEKPEQFGLDNTAYNEDESTKM